MSEEYVARTESGYYVAKTRVSLDSIVYAFLEGQTAEAIAQAFPVLTLEQVYGAVTYYLAHREQVDEYLGAQRDHRGGPGREQPGRGLSQGVTAICRNGGIQAPGAGLGPCR